MDAVRAVSTRARQRVAALDDDLVPSTRELRDVRVAALMRRAPAAVRHAMRDEGTLRPWWDRSPVLLLVVPMVVAYAFVFSDPLAAMVGTCLSVWALMSEPRWNRAEKRERAQLMTVYRNTVADELMSRADRLSR